MNRIIQTGVLTFVGACCLACGAAAQSLDEELDEKQYLQGLVDLGLREVLEHYIETHPANDPVVDARYRIAVERLRLNEPGVSRADRRSIVERILDIREQLIEQHADDRRRAIWLADQAQDLLFELLPIDGDGLRALFGMPSAQQFKRAQQIAARMNRLTALAELEIEQAIRAIESAPGYAGDIAKQIQRRQLAREQRDLRIPFLRGVAAFLHAELNVQRSSEREELYDIAGESLDRVIAELRGDVKIRARNYLGFATLRLGDVQHAEQLFDTIAGVPEAPLADQFLAGVGRAQIHAARQQPRRALNELAMLASRYANREHVFFRLLIADQQYQLRRKIAEQSVASRQAARMSEAFASYTTLLDEQLGVDSKQKVDLVLDRLTRVIHDATSLPDPPAIVNVARAAHLAQHADDKDKAVTLLEQVLAGDDLDQNTRTAARLQLAEAYRAANDPLRSAQQLLHLARNNESHNDALTWAQQAAALAWSAYQDDPHDQAAKTLDDAVSRLLDSHSNKLDDVGRWRYVAGRLALDQNRLDDAIGYFNSVEHASSRWADAQFMLASAHRERLRRAETPAERHNRAQTLQRIVTEAGSALQQQYQTVSDPSRIEAIQYYRDYLHVFEAEALIRLHEPQRALALLKKFEDRARTSQALKAASLRARLEAHQNIGSIEQAVDDVHTLLVESPEQASQVVVTMLDALCDRVRQLQATGQRDVVKETTRGMVAPLAMSVHKWLRDQPAEAKHRRAARRATARALRTAGVYEKALQHYEILLQDQPDAANVLAGKADCLFQLGGEQRLGEAMLIFRRIAQAGPDVGADPYWLSQLRMLQILDQVDRNTDRIAPRIERLRREDETLGGPWYLRQFEQLQLKYASGR